MVQSKKQRLWQRNFNGEIRRQMLRDIVPLTTPLSVHIETSSACCLKCNYCPQSLPLEQRKNIGHGVMTMSLFRKVVDDCVEFPKKLKSLRFAGFGEPLLNPKIAQMVSYARDRQMAESIIIFTNALRLSHPLAEQLAGLVDTLLIDIQGTSAQEYQNVANTEIDFDELVDNIAYLYNIPNRRCKMTIKSFKFIADKDREKFFRIFENICDEICIENITRTYPGIDYDGMITDEKEDMGKPFCRSDYCSYPFYQLTVTALGGGKCLLLSSGNWEWHALCG